MKTIKEILKDEINEYKQWKANGHDCEYCYDEIWELFSDTRRATMYELMEYLVRE